MFESTLASKITASTSFTDLAGDRLYPVTLPEEPTYPCVTYQRITTTRQYTLVGPITLNRVRMQFDVWAQSYKECKQLQAALLAILEDHTNYTDGIDSITLNTITDGYASEVPVYRVMMDFFAFVAE